MMKKQQSSAYGRLRKRISEIIEVGYVEDFVGRAYDVINFGFIAINLTVSVMLTFDEMIRRYGALLELIEGITVAFYALDLILRLWTAGCIYPKLSEPAALLRYVLSFNGLVDILSCLPYYMPVFFPSGMAAFRIFRVMRIFRIFRVNAYFDSLNVITEVIRNKAKLLISSVFVILMLMLAASLSMYSLEHAAQPEAFDNALSGLWWAVASLLTVGYGDIYPITAAGKLFGMGITMLGVGLVAIPTGIISAGFVEQYEKMRAQAEEAAVTDLQFIRVELKRGDQWIGKKISELGLPRTILIAAVQREDKILVPRGVLELAEGDSLVLAMDGEMDDLDLSLTEIQLKERHKWNGQEIRDLDISRQSFIVMIRRGKKILIPNGKMKLEAGDTVVLYTRRKEDKKG